MVHISKILCILNAFFKHLRWLQCWQERWHAATRGIVKELGMSAWSLARLCAQPLDGTCLGRVLPCRKKMQKPVTALSASRFCTSNLLTSCRFYSNETAGFLAGPDVIELVDKDVLIFSCFCFCSAVFEEPEDPSNRSFFSEIISSISDVKFSHSGRYIMTRDYLTVKVWDLNMENRPIETYQVRTTTYPQVHKALPLQASISASGWKAYNAQE